MHVLSVALWIRASLLLDNPSLLILCQVQAFLGLTVGGLGLTRVQMPWRRASLVCTTADASGVWLVSCIQADSPTQRIALQGLVSELDSGPVC